MNGSSHATLHPYRLFPAHPDLSRPESGRAPGDRAGNRPGLRYFCQSRGQGGPDPVATGLCEKLAWPWRRPGTGQGPCHHQGRHFGSGNRKPEIAGMLWPELVLPHRSRLQTEECTEESAESLPGGTGRVHPWRHDQKRQGTGKAAVPGQAGLKRLLDKKTGSASLEP